MDRKPSLNIPGRYLAFYVLCSSILAGFVLMKIYPDQRELAQENRNIYEQRLRIEKQKNLFPFYEGLTEEIKKLRKFKALVPDPPVKKISLNPDDIEKGLMDIRNAAERNRLETESIEPDMASMNRMADQVQVNVRLRGNFMDFRNFMLRLMRLEYLDAIDDIQISSDETSENIRLKIWLRTMRRERDGSPARSR